MSRMAMANDALVVNDGLLMVCCVGLDFAFCMILGWDSCFVWLIDGWLMVCRMCMLLGAVLTWVCGEVGGAEAELLGWLKRHVSLIVDVMVVLVADAMLLLFWPKVVVVLTLIAGGGFFCCLDVVLLALAL